MKVELFHAPGCNRCAAAREGLKAAAQAAVPGLEWREVNVLDEMDYAVDRGVLSLPAIVTANSRSRPCRHRGNYARS